MAAVPGVTRRLRDAVRDSKIRKDIPSKPYRKIDSFASKEDREYQDLDGWRHHRKQNSYRVERDLPRRPPAWDCEGRNKWNQQERLPTFDGSSIKLDFLDWIDAFEDYFQILNPPDAVKCKLVASKLQGEAYLWWKELQHTRFLEGKNLITSWERMRNILHSKFLHTSRLTYFYKQENESDGKHAKCSMKGLSGIQSISSAGENIFCNEGVQVSKHVEQEKAELIGFPDRSIHDKSSERVPSESYNGPVKKDTAERAKSTSDGKDEAILEEAEHNDGTIHEEENAQRKPVSLGANQFPISKIQVPSKHNGNSSLLLAIADLENSQKLQYEIGTQHSNIKNIQEKMLLSYPWLTTGRLAEHEDQCEVKRVNLMNEAMNSICLTYYHYMVFISPFRKLASFLFDPGGFMCPVRVWTTWLIKVQSEDAVYDDKSVDEKLLEEENKSTQSLNEEKLLDEKTTNNLEPKHCEENRKDDGLDEGLNDLQSTKEVVMAPPKCSVKAPIESNNDGQNDVSNSSSLYATENLMRSFNYGLLMENMVSNLVFENILWPCDAIPFFRVVSMCLDAQFEMVVPGHSKNASASVVVIDVREMGNPQLCESPARVMHINQTLNLEVSANGWGEEYNQKYARNVDDSGCAHNVDIPKDVHHWSRIRLMPKLKDMQSGKLVSFLFDPGRNRECKSCMSDGPAQLLFHAASLHFSRTPMIDYEIVELKPKHKMTFEFGDALLHSWSKDGFDAPRTIYNLSSCSWYQMVAEEGLHPLNLGLIFHIIIPFDPGGIAWFLVDSNYFISNCGLFFNNKVACKFALCIHANILGEAFVITVELVHRLVIRICLTSICWYTDEFHEFRNTPTQFWKGSRRKSLYFLSQVEAIRTFLEPADFIRSVHQFISFVFDPSGFYILFTVSSDRINSECCFGHQHMLATLEMECFERNISNLYESLVPCVYLDDYGRDGLLKRNEKSLSWLDAGSNLVMLLSGQGDGYDTCKIRWKKMFNIQRILLELCQSHSYGLL